MGGWCGQYQLACNEIPYLSRKASLCVSLVSISEGQSIFLLYPWCSLFILYRAVLTIIIMRNLQGACSLALMTRTRWTTYEVRKDRQQYWWLMKMTNIENAKRYWVTRTAGIVKTKREVANRQNLGGGWRWTSIVWTIVMSNAQGRGVCFQCTFKGFNVG